jgi:hypothetical protein
MYEMKRDVTDYFNFAIQWKLTLIFEDFPKVKVSLSDLIFSENLASLIT